MTDTEQTQTPAQAQAQPQARSQTQYAYPERSFKTELTLFMLFGPILVSLLITTVYYYAFSGRVPLPLVKSTGYFTITLVFAVICYNSARAVARSKSIIIENDRVIKKSPRGICYVHYADISGIRLFKIPYLKHRITLITSSKETLSIPLSVRGGQAMVESIFQKMRAAGTLTDNSGTMMQKLGNMSRRLNMLYDLRNRNIPNIVRAMTCVAMLHGAAAILFWDSGLVVVIPFGITGMLLQAAAYFVAERFHLNALIRDDGKVWGDETGKTRYGVYYLITGLTALLIGMTVGIFWTNPV